MIDLNHGPLGAYFQCFKNKHATEQVLIHFRKYYPDSPIFLVSDDGDNFLEIARRYGCNYFHAWEGMGLNHIETPQALIFLDRLLMCAQTIKSHNLLILEDDVLIKSRLYGNYPYDFVGPFYGNEFNPLTRKILERYRGIENPPHYFGGSGGTVVDWLNISDRIIAEYEDLKLFLKYLYNYNKEIDQQKCIDYLLSTIIAFLGGTYGKLDCLGEIIRQPNCINDPHIAIIHQFKLWN